MLHYFCGNKTFILNINLYIKIQTILGVFRGTFPKTFAKLHNLSKFGCFFHCSNHYPCKIKKPLYSLLFVIFCVVANPILVCLNFSLVKLLFVSSRQAETVCYSVSSEYAGNGNYVSETYSSKLLQDTTENSLS